MKSLLEHKKTNRRCFWSTDGGSSLIETALVLPIFVTLLTGAIDYGLAWHIKLELSAAAEAGALYGIQFPADIAGMQAAAGRDVTDLTGLTVAATYGTECSDGTSPISLSATMPTCSGTPISYVEVDTSYLYRPALPFPGLGSSVGIIGKSRMRQGLSQ